MVSRSLLRNGALLVLALMALSACARAVERPPGPGPSPLPPTATAVPTAAATASATALPSATPVSGPAPVATPTKPPVAAATPATAPTVGPAPVARATATATAVATRTATPLPPALAPTTSPTPVPPPALEVRGPADGSSVQTNAVVVHGITTPGATVIVNGVGATVGADGRFQTEIVLASGANTIEVVASDARGNRATRTLSVTSLAPPAQPFVLLVTEPRDQSIVSTGTLRLSGRTGPSAVVTVKGVGVPVDAAGLFFTTVTLEPGPNIIDVVATSADGQSLSTVIAVIFRARAAQ